MSENTCLRILVAHVLVNLEMLAQLCFLTRQALQIDIESVSPIIVIPLTRPFLAMCKMVLELMLFVLL